MQLPSHIFFTGVPGSRWSGIAQTIETIPGMNTSDRTLERNYTHHTYTGHVGAYFGRSMEFEAWPVISYVDQAWAEPGGCKLVKSHEWVDHWDRIEFKEHFKDDWKMLVYRPDQSSFAWWHEAGGFQIKYPDYSAYGNSANILSEIIRVNNLILDYACINNCTWSYFTSEWIEDNFNEKIDVAKVHPDILVTLIKS